MISPQYHNADSQNKPFRHYFVATGKALAVIFLLAVFVHFSWNMFAPDMFGLEVIRMKQALGLVVFAGAFAVLFRIGSHKSSPSATV